MYGGAFHEQAIAEAKDGLEEALRNGYTIERIAWSHDSRYVTVDYLYDPDGAPRPL